MEHYYSMTVKGSICKPPTCYRVFNILYINRTSRFSVILIECRALNCISVLLSEMRQLCSVRSQTEQQQRGITHCTALCVKSKGVHTCTCHVCTRSPGAADIIATLPLLQHLFTGLQGCSRAEEDLFKLHLCEQQTGRENTHTHKHSLLCSV